MKNLSIMLKPASSLCNMRCKYCFYADVASLRDVKSFGVMTQSTVKAMLAKTAASLSDGDRINFAFQGGEPTMAGLEYFKGFVHEVESLDVKIKASYALQTNAVLLDEAWCTFLAEKHFLVGVSCDILPECHDSVRLDANGEGTYARVLSAIKLLEKHHVDYNVLCTLTNTVARHPQQVWKRLLQLDVKYVQFTPCLGELDVDGNTVYELTPRRFADFYTTLFKLWFEDYKAGKYRSVKLFDDVVNLLAFGMPTACGMGGQCQPQIIVEGDGSVYPCDFYCIDEYKLGNAADTSVVDLLLSDKMKQFHARPHTQPKLCATCKYGKFCGGGCKRMQKEMCLAENDAFCGYGEFLNNTIEDFMQIARREQQYRQQN